MLSWKRIAWVNETDSSFTHGWCFEGAGRTRWTTTCFLLPFRLFGFGSVFRSQKNKRHIARTEYYISVHLF